MKKLIMLALVAAACSAQAAAISWNSGSLKSPTAVDGSTTGGSNIGAAAGYMTVWYFSSLANANAFVSSGYTDGTKLFTSTVAGESGLTKDTSTTGGMYSGVTANVFAASATYYTVAYVQTTTTGNAIPAMNDVWYRYSSIGTLTTQSTGNTSINYLSGLGVGGSTLWSANWTKTTPVPEPATAALALAGLAMLIRRRK